MTDTNHRRTGKAKAERLTGGRRDSLRRAPCQARAWSKRKKLNQRKERRKGKVELKNVVSSTSPDVPDRVRRRRVVVP